MEWKFWKLGEYKNKAIAYGLEVIELKEKVRNMETRSRYNDLIEEGMVETLREEIKRELCNETGVVSIKISDTIHGRKWDRLSRDKALENARLNYQKLQQEYFKLKQEHDAMALHPWENNAAIAVDDPLALTTQVTNEIKDILKTEQKLQDKNPKPKKKGKKNGKK